MVTVPGLSGFSYHIRFTRMLFGIQYLMFDFSNGKHSTQATSEISTEVVPTKTGRLASVNSLISSTTALNFSLTVYKLYPPGLFVEWVCWSELPLHPIYKFPRIHQPQFLQYPSYLKACGTS
jgi:hypothetical protein